MAEENPEPPSSEQPQEAERPPETDHERQDAVGRVAEALQRGLPRFVLLSSSPRPAPGRPVAYEPPTVRMRSEAREAVHDRAIQDIARERFGFPTAKHRDLKTYVNHPRRTMGVEMPGGYVAYPDIVVVQHPENYTKILAEVETNETVTEDVARYEWLPYAELAPLYIYVPVGKADGAVSLCKRLAISVVGIRTWRYVVGRDEIEINDHFTVPAGPEELLPRILTGR